MGLHQYLHSKGSSSVKIQPVAWQKVSVSTISLKGLIYKIDEELKEISVAKIKKIP